MNLFPRKDPAIEQIQLSPAEAEAVRNGQSFVRHISAGGETINEAAEPDWLAHHRARSRKFSPRELLHARLYGALLSARGVAASLSRYSTEADFPGLPSCQAENARLLTACEEAGYRELFEKSFQGGYSGTGPIATIPPEESNDELANVKAVVFMRLNAARDRRDKKAITILEEIMEACR